MENIFMMTNPIALIAVEIPQLAMARARREELQRKAGSRLQRFKVFLFKIRGLKKLLTSDFQLPTKFF